MKKKSDELGIGYIILGYILLPFVALYKLIKKHGDEQEGLYLFLYYFIILIIIAQIGELIENYFRYH